MPSNQVSLHIAGLNILVTTPEDEEYVTQIAQEIDEYVTAILQKASGASVTNAVLLCAIEYLDSYKKANRTANNMRSQIKEYLSEAANAKMECDEEKKKNDELVIEIQALRNHLTRIATEGDNSGIIQKLRDDFNSVNDDLEKLRKRNVEVTAQNKSLSEKNEAMNTYIAGQDREIARLSAVTEELNGRLIDKTNVISELSERLSGYESQVADLLGETNRLKSELELLEEMIHAEKAQRDKDDQRKQDAKKRDFMVNINDLYQPPAKTPATPDADGANAAPEQEKPDIEVSAEQPKEPVPAPAEVSAQAQPPLEDLNPFVRETRHARVSEADMEADIASVIQQVNEKQSTSSGRSMRDFDIDISDLPNILKSNTAPAGEPAAKAEGDAFHDYKIDEDDTVLGFSSVNKVGPDPGEAAALEQVTEDVPPPADADVPWRKKFDAALSAERIPLNEVKPAPLQAAAPSAVKHADDLLVEDADSQDMLFGGRDLTKKKRSDQDDDSVPDLSWTLDV